MHWVNAASQSSSILNLRIFMWTRAIASCVSEYEVSWGKDSTSIYSNYTTGVEITKCFGFSFGNVPKRSTRLALFLPVLDRQADSKLKAFGISFRKVSKIFTCPALFLPVRDRRTVCNFHPCNKSHKKKVFSKCKYIVHVMYFSWPSILQPVSCVSSDH